LGFREKKEEFKKQIKKSSSNPSTHPIETKFARVVKTDLRSAANFVRTDLRSAANFVRTDLRGGATANFVRTKPPQMIEERQISKLPLATQSADKCKIDVLRMPKAREQPERSSGETKGRKFAPELRCQASTKKNGTPCHNSALSGTNYCGISSHKKLG
jgi:hypothetical protein